MLKQVTDVLSPTQITLIFGFIVLVTIALLHRWFLKLLGIILIPEDSLGIVNKKYVLTGNNRSLPEGSIIALNGEAGWQADTLAPGVHYGYWPWQYNVKIEEFTIIPEDKIGCVEARDGVPIEPGRVLAKHVDCNLFQNASKFIKDGGQRGSQITVIPPGTYRINTELFTISLEEQKEVGDDMVGIVTTLEGAPLEADDIAGAKIEGHNLFQNGQAFLDGNGKKGLQEQVILAGRYFINPWFAEVEEVPMTIVPIAHVGVIISYVGKKGTDVTGEEFKHANMVDQGFRGVWREPLDPGKYPLNTRIYNYEEVPTANVVLNWATGKTESHNLDKNLSTITARSSDGYAYNLDVSQIIHIGRADAALVIARFGNMLNLVTQVLEPTIGNYFRNAAQGSDVIDFLKNRQERQEDAKQKIAAALQHYNVNAVETLIGDIVPPAELMKTLTDRKLAEQEKLTFKTQMEAQEEKKKYEQAKATADTQAGVVSAERKVETERFSAQALAQKALGDKQAAITRAEGEAEARKTNAAADAFAKETVGRAEAAAIEAVGTAESRVIQLKTSSLGSSNFAGIEVAKALSNGHLKLVPEIMMSGNGNGHSGVAEVLMATMLREKMTQTPKTE